MKVSPLQRGVIVLYLLVVAFCCTWVPWRVEVVRPYDKHFWRISYAWVWSGPNWTNPDGLRLSATPDMSMIELRFLAVTAFCATVYLALAFFQRAGTLERRWPKLSEDQWKVALREFKLVHVPEETNKEQ